MLPRIDLDIKGAPRETKVVVAMSGGVDLVAAALVKNAGYDVWNSPKLYDTGLTPVKGKLLC